MGPSAQKDEFARWRASISDLSDCKINSSRMCDISNPTQLADEIEPQFARNQAVINFWLRVVVLRRQTQQFKEQRSKSSWDLLDESSRTIGFAGTNDVRPLLPLDIHECRVEDMEVQSTNASMLERIRDHTLGVVECKNSDLTGLVELATRATCRALIDAGGLLAGVSTEKVIAALLEHNSAVTIFNIDKSTWMVYYRDGRVLTRSSSPTPTSETFAVFDQSRCRGADLQLRQDCCALLTLNPKITKAELVQAAGRMRGLGRGQKLLIAAAPDVWRSLEARGSDVGVANLIRFTQSISITSQRLGLMRWGAQGRISALGQVQLCQFRLSELYGQMEAIATAADDSATQDVKNRFAQLRLRQELFAKDWDVVETGADAECERELEHEMEKEKEKDWEIAIARPRAETEGIIDENGDLCFADCQTMSDAVRSFLPRFRALTWPTRLCCTRNFIKPTADVEPPSAIASDVSNYQKSVDMVLVLQDKRVVLISHLEAEELLNASNANFKFAIANWLTLHICAPAAAAVGMARGTSPALLVSTLLQNARMMAAISLFAGEGKLPCAAPSSDLDELVQRVQDQDVLFEWFKMRNKHTHFAESDAEDALLRRKQNMRSLHREEENRIPNPRRLRGRLNGKGLPTTYVGVDDARDSAVAAFADLM